MQNRKRSRRWIELSTALEPRVLFSGAPGTLDTSYGFNGLAGSDYPNLPSIQNIVQHESLAVQSSGNLVLGLSDGSIYDYLPDGDLNAAFGNNGKLTQSTDPTEFAQAAVQSNGDIIVASIDTMTKQFLVSRYSPAGVLDTTFGINGTAAISADSTLTDATLYGTQLAVNASDQIFVAGTLTYNTSSSSVYAFAMASLDALGNASALHSYTFPAMYGGGTQITFNAMTLAGNDVILGGQIPSTNSSNVGGTEFGLLALKADGTLDTSFGSGGYVGTQLGQFDYLYGMGVQSSGDIVAVGTSDQSFAMVRYTPTGSVDTTFGTNGHVIDNDPLGELGGQAFSIGASVAVGSDDSIYIGGLVQSQGAILHYSPTGLLLQSNANPATPGYPLDLNANDNSDFTTVAMDNGSPVFAGWYESLNGLDSTGFEMQRTSATLTPDPTFGADEHAWQAGIPAGTVLGDDGSVLVNSSSVASAVQPSGKVVFVIPNGGTEPAFTLPVDMVRFNVDGSHDLTFNPPAGVTGTAIASESDGKLIIAGNTSTGVIRLNSDGTLDSTFTANHSITAAVIKIVPLSDGDILIAAGQSVYRLLPNGGTDTTFGTAGVSTGPARTISDLAVAANGSFVTAGNEVIAKFTAAGAFDTTFNGTGTLTVPAYYDDEVDGTTSEIPVDSSTTLAQQNVAIDSAGDIVASGPLKAFFQYGFHDEALESQGQVLRYLPNGTLDATFGNQGAEPLPITTYLGSFIDFSGITSIGIESDGKVLLASLQNQVTAEVGGTTETVTPHPFVDRLTALGQEDSTFTPYASTTALDPLEIAQSPSGQIIVAGVGASQAEVIQLNSGITLSTAPVTGVSPAVSKYKAPASMISGQKESVTLALTLTNTTAAALRGVSIINIYASTDGVLDSLSTRLVQVKHNMTLKANAAAKLNVGASLKSLPAGSYTLIVQVTDPAGAVLTANGPAVSVYVPVVSLVPTITVVSVPANLKKSSISVTITNTGNVTSTGFTTIAIYASASSEGASPTLLLSKRVKIGVKAGKAAKVRLALSAVASLTTGDYFIVTQVTDSAGATQSVTSDSAVAVS